MKASVLFAPNTPFETRTVELDKPMAREVRLRVAASGLCHSDWHYASGDLPTPLPVVIGHEVAGIVEAVGDEVTGLRPGDHVVSCALGFCGHCEQCVSGRTQICSDKPVRSDSEPPRMRIDGEPITQGSRIGGFAEEVLVHQNAIVKIDRTMPLDRAALLGCGVLTGFGSVFNAARVGPSSRVAVIGAGGVGLNVIQAAEIAGASQIVAIDINPSKEQLARHFGATHFVQGGEKAVEEVRDLTSGGVEYAFEVIGLPETIAQGVHMLAPAGLMTIIGATKLGATIPLPGVQMLFNEWRVQGTFFGSSPFTRDIPRIARMYNEGRIDLDHLISRRISLAEINEGFEAMLQGDGARNVIVFDDVLADAAARA